MRCVGIVAEYNPFHNGHRYHIEKAKEISGADCAVCVMSGNFVQRGGPAVADKWVRAEMALAAGADLVVELPLFFAMNVAEVFAVGAVSILDALGGVDAMCFGSECADMDVLSQAAQILNDEPEALSREIAKRLKDGEGYPAARAGALSALFGVDAGMIQSPNNILAVEYLRSIRRLHSSIKAFNVARYKAGYHSLQPVDHIASATAVRDMMQKEMDLSDYIPESALEVLGKAEVDGVAPVAPAAFDSAVISFLRVCDREGLKSVNHMGEGLHNRIKSAALGCCTVQDLVDRVATKRYTNARILRAIWSAFLRVGQDHCPALPSYIRVLGMNARGKALLAQARGGSKLPVITKLADFDVANDRLMQLDILGTDIYSMGYPDARRRVGGLDYTTSPVVV